MKWGVVAACGYELASIIGGKTPTITMLCARHRWLGPLVLLTLAIHLYGQPQKRGTGDCPLCPDMEV